MEVTSVRRPRHASHDALRLDFPHAGLFPQFAVADNANVLSIKDGWRLPQGAKAPKWASRKPLDTLLGDAGYDIRLSAAPVWSVGRRTCRSPAWRR